MNENVNAKCHIHGQPLLSVCIPTYNRVQYLRETLPELLKQVEQVCASGVSVELLVSDNHSPDDTNRYVKELAGDRISYYRNRSNIGADRNFLTCIRRAKGTYVWLFGDDELILQDGIAAIVRVLHQSAPALVILIDPKLLPNVHSPAEYPDYASCLKAVECLQSEFALSHGLISRNVFKKTAFSMRVGHQTIPTSLAHMYGLFDQLRHGGKIVLLNGVVQTRMEKPDFASWPGGNWGNLCIKLAGYLHHVGTLFNVAEPKYAARKMILLWPLEFFYVLARRTGTVPFFRAVRKVLGRLGAYLEKFGSGRNGA